MLIVRILISVLLLAITEILAYPQQQQQKSQPQQQQQQQQQQEHSEKKPSIHHKPRFVQEDTTSNKKVVETTEKEIQLPGVQVLDNPSYDPNLYSSFIPQDTVQQYVSSYTGPYAPAGPYVPAFTVQSGYEGYLIPDVQSSSSSSELATNSGFYKIINDLIPTTVLVWIAKSATVFLTLIGVVFFGGAITSAFCSLTQLCSISFTSLPFLKLKSTAESISRAFGGDFLNPEHIGQTAEFLREAIEKYSQLEGYEGELESLKRQ